VISDNDGATPIGGKGQLNVRLEWTSDADLTVRFPASAEVIRQETEHGAVHINYVAN
jgi:hypothetical protein